MAWIVDDFWVENIPHCMPAEKQIANDPHAFAIFNICP
jgi:hypothetical protein